MRFVGCTIKNTQNYLRLSSRNFHVDFNDSRASFKSKSFKDLLRSYIVFNICKSQYLVKNADKLLSISTKLLGASFTNFILKSTFFSQFCAGEDPIEIKPVVKYLENNGVGSILDYCAEADIKVEEDSKDIKVSTAQQCRVYDYRDEELCDIHAKTFESCINAVKAVSPTGFAAIKITALGNPMLLERMSTAIVELQNFYKRLDEDKSGFLSRKKFVDGFNANFDGLDAEKEFQRMDINNSGKISYIEWTNSIPLEELHLLTGKCKSVGPLASASLNDDERKLMKQLQKRADSLAKLASDLGVRLMIDAEHSYFQPAIDNITSGLARKYNKNYPVIFNTYQMYLKDSIDRLRFDIEVSKRENFKFAAKLVRGAYMDLERRRAEEKKYTDPIHATIQDTHANYNSALVEVIHAISKGENIEIMIASHNQESVELALSTIKEKGLNSSSNIYFGQLLGMSDHLTFTLGANGFKAYKYVPYGKVDEVIPYLLRRAQENSGMLGGATKELKMLSSEIFSRLKGNK